MLPDLKTIKISEPAHRALSGAGIKTLEQAAQCTRRQLLALHGFGPKGLRLLEEALRAYGLELKDEA